MRGTVLLVAVLKINTITKDENRAAVPTAELAPPSL